MGETYAVFHIFGRRPESRESLKMECNGEDSDAAHSDNTFGWKLSGPGAEETFRWERISWTFWTVKVMSSNGVPKYFFSNVGRATSPSMTKTDWKVVF